MPPIYLDHNSTTPVSPAVKAAVMEAMDEVGNASSSHTHGTKARERVESARACVSSLLSVPADRVWFNSGATEGNNACLRGVVRAWVKAHPNAKPHVVTTAVEHSSVLAVARDMEAWGLCDVTIVPVGASGIVDPAAVAAAVRPTTALVSVMGANNETGNIMPLARIRALIPESVPLHSDLAQAAGKVPFPAGSFDLATMSFHKLGSVAGSGAFFVREGVPFLSPSAGGSQQDGMRPGTLPAVLAAAAAAACQEFRSAWTTGESRGGLRGEGLRQAYLRDTLLAQLRNALGGMLSSNGAHDPYVFDGIPQEVSDGSLRKRLPGNANFTLVGICPFAFTDEVRPLLSVSSASACKNTGHGERSHVLDAIGSEAVGADVRLSVGSDTTMEDVNAVVDIIVNAARKLDGQPCKVPSR